MTFITCQLYVSIYKIGVNDISNIVDLPIQKYYINVFMLLIKYSMFIMKFVRIMKLVYSVYFFNYWQF